MTSAAAPDFAAAVTWPVGRLGASRHLGLGGPVAPGTGDRVADLP
jgi:hypothetical protein